jgi:hypothetical protein
MTDRQKDDSIHPLLMKTAAAAAAAATRLKKKKEPLREKSPTHW